MKKLLTIVFVLLMGLALLTACGESANTEEQGNNGTEGTEGTEETVDNSLQSVLDSGVLRVGMCPEYPPFESIDEQNNIVGFDPALAQAIGEEMGVEVECLNIPWESLIAGLNNGDFDVIMSAMSPEEATAATDAVELSENYYVLADVIVVMADNDEITCKEDLAGKVVGVQDACAATTAAESLADMGIEVAKLNHYTRNVDAYADMKNGNIEAIVVGATYAKAQAANNPEFKVIDDPIQAPGICMVAKKGAVELIDAMEEALAVLQENGTYAQIENEWLAQ